MRLAIAAPVLVLTVLAGCASSSDPGLSIPPPPPHIRTLESPVIFGGDSWSHVFTKTGEVPYMCHPHESMRGTLTILADDGTPDAVSIEIYEHPDGAMGYTPQNVTLRVGDTVTWTNTGRAAHSLMALEDMKE